MFEDFGTISKEYFKTFCYHYKLALVELNNQRAVVACNHLAKEIFQYDGKAGARVNFMDYCKSKQLNCPLATLEEQGKGYCLSAYQHLQGAVFKWHLVRLKNYSEQLFLVGKSFSQAHPFPRASVKRDAYFIDHLPLLIYAKDMKGNYIRANQTAKFFANHTLIGFNDQEVLSHEAKKLYHGAPCRDSEDETAPTSSEVHLRGMQAHTNLSKKIPLLDKAGKTCGYLFIEVPSLSLPKLADLNKHSIQTQSKPLTIQEKQCLKWMVKGKSAEQIGLILGLSKRTIESMFSQLKRKYKVKNMFQLGCHMHQFFSDELLTSD